MRQYTLLYSLYAHLFITITALAEDEECLKGPLILPEQPTCAVSTLVKKHTFQDDAWEWKTQKSDAWDGPYDCIGEYCVYVSRDLDRLGGMVLISAETNVHVIDSFTKNDMFRHETQPFDVAEMPGKGIGLVANRTIKRGEIIMQTTPAMLIQFGPHLDFDEETRLNLYKRAAKRLPKETYERLMRQYGTDEYHKLDRNAFTIFINGNHTLSGHLAIYPDVARMNHDCRPKYVIFLPLFSARARLTRTTAFIIA